MSEKELRDWLMWILLFCGLTLGMTVSHIIKSPAVNVEVCQTGGEDG